MSVRILRLNASSLRALGMDQPTVDALMEILRIAGIQTGGITVPELSGKVVDNSDAIEAVHQQVVLIQLSTDYLEAAPAPVQPDAALLDALRIAPPAMPQIVAERVESLQTEVRQLAEQVAVLMKMLQEDIGPRTDQAIQSAEFLQTEVRQIADQQISNANLIQELKQGTML